MNTTPADIHTAIKDLTGRDRLYQRLADLIPHQDTVLESTIGSHNKHLAPPIPWNEPAALLYMDIHAGAREHEANLTLLLFRRATYRGGADELTIQALERLPVLLDAAHDAGLWDRPVVQDAARAVALWPVLVRRMLDESRPSEVPWTRAPGGLRCPHCGSVLQLPPGWQYAGDQAEVVCRNPECRDDDGARRQWPASAWLARLAESEQEQDDEERGLVTAAEAAHRFGLEYGTIRVWKYRGKVAPVGHDGKGREVYQAADIAALVDDGERVTA